ncbi:MAG: alpha-amylase family glycosyl hydrolase, partial [Chloroflexota bacterium]|nr:alpha-amylase family glycosyl hydrolase [Chloroflexota bacterium]
MSRVGYTISGWLSHAAEMGATILSQYAFGSRVLRAWALLLLTILVSVAPVAGQRGATPATNVSATSNWWDEAVCYEVFVRSFADSDGDGIGDLLGLIDRLDYINDGDPNGGDDLGATCIWLMPVFASTSYHGYDVEDYYTIDPDYGTNEEFTEFITQAHDRGIRVILDLVLNHTSREHPWFQDALANPDSPYRGWYIWADEHPGYNGPWGAPAWHPSPLGDEFYYGIFWEGMPDLNYRNAEVTAEAEKVSAFWLNEMGADGFRLDAIKHLIEDERIQENTPETHEWLRDYRIYLAE